MAEELIQDPACGPVLVTRDAEGQEVGHRHVEPWGAVTQTMEEHMADHRAGRAPSPPAPHSRRSH